jgi:glycyl-tRNA synthetase beta chain
VNAGLLLETAEQELAAAIAGLAETASPLFEQGNYSQGLYLLAELKQPVDHFFDKVLVMADQDDLRNNRLALLQSLSDLFLQVADISRLQ